MSGMDSESPATQQLLCRWAEKKWGLAGVTEVDFHSSDGWNGTADTPGYQGEQIVYLTLADGSTRHYEDVRLTTDLINEILGSR